MHSVVSYELENTMINCILYVLEKIPYRTKFGLSLADVLKVLYYHNYGVKKFPEKCLCGGLVQTITRQYSPEDVSWDTECSSCGFIYDEG